MSQIQMKCLISLSKIYFKSRPGEINISFLETRSHPVIWSPMLMDPQKICTSPLTYF